MPLELEAELDALGRALLEALRSDFGPARPLQSLGAAPCPVPRLPDFVLESETGLVLGEAPARSLSLAVPVFAPFEPGAWTFGAAFTPGAQPYDYLQVLVVQASPPASRALVARLGSLRSLARRVPGYFAHGVGIETVARVHRTLLQQGFSQDRLAGELVRLLRDEGFGGSVAVAVGLPSRPALARLAPLAEQFARVKDALAGARSGGPAGGEGCEDRDCRTCDERVVCDKVREVLAQDRRAAAK